jgi:hypothetical protein
MTLSELTRSVSAIRDILVAAYSAPGINTMWRVAYRLPIAVSPFLLTLSVSSSEEHSGVEGQLWPYVGMGSLGTRLHWDCAAMGDAAKTSPRVPSTCAPNVILSLIIIHIISRSQISVAIDNWSLVPSFYCLTTSSYLWNYAAAADEVSHTGNLRSNCGQCFAHFYKFRDEIQVTQVSRYCGERQR